MLVLSDPVSPLAAPTMSSTPLPSDVDSARELLRVWREDNVRRSADVVELWDSLLSVPSLWASLGDEKWMVLEQVAVAAMDCHRKDVVDACLREIKREFDLDSFRVRRLYAMR